MQTQIEKAGTMWRFSHVYPRPDLEWGSGAAQTDVAKSQVSSLPPHESICGSNPAVLSVENSCWLKIWTVFKILRLYSSNACCVLRIIFPIGITSFKKKNPKTSALLDQYLSLSYGRGLIVSYSNSFLCV